MVIAFPWVQFTVTVLIELVVAEGLSEANATGAAVNVQVATTFADTASAELVVAAGIDPETQMLPPIAAVAASRRRRWLFRAVWPGAIPVLEKDRPPQGSRPLRGFTFCLRYLEFSDRFFKPSIGGCKDNLSYRDIKPVSGVLGQRQCDVRPSPMPPARLLP
jgi:hypothetical protein